MAKKRILLILISLILLAALGGGGFFAYRMFFGGEEVVAEEETAPAPEPAIGPVYALDPFLVNLADPGRPRFLKLVAQVELDSPAVQGELETLRPRVRDSLLTLLSSKSSTDLVSVADKERLRNEILHRLNAFLSGGRVVEVYFIDFVVQ